MKKIEKILVPTDFSKNALNAFRYAIWFADNFEASIHLVHVSFPTAEPLDYPAMAAQILQQQIGIAEVSMKNFIARAMVQTHAGYEPNFVPLITSEIVAGTPRNQINQLADEKNFDLIIMGTQGQHNSYEKAFGSVAYNTMKKSVCPVLIIPENAKGYNIDSVAYATNFTEVDPFNIWKVGKLLSPFNPIMRIVHVEKNPDEKGATNMKELEEFFEDHPPGLQITFHQTATESIEKGLQEFEDIWNVDLMVMSRPSRSFFEQLFHKSMTKKMALNSNVPLLVLKSEETV